MAVLTSKREKNPIIITRMKFSELDAPAMRERVAVAKEAEEKLGYGRLSNAFVMPNALLFGLRELGYEPFVPSKVKDYQIKKAKPGMWSGHKAAIWWAVAAAIALVSAIEWQINWSTFSMSAAAVIGFFLLAIFMTMRAIFLAIDSSARGHRALRSWERVSISNYPGNVPLSVIRKALAIKSKVPDAQVAIEYLVVTEERIQRRDPDPFMVVSLKNESYYIDVWDEGETESYI